MIIINGRFLSQEITGVQRFAHEIIRELDKLVKPGEYKILIPKNYIYKDLKYKNIDIEICGNLRGHLWEQIELPFFVLKNRGKLLNLCNTAPLINPGIVAIHDVQTVVHPEFFNKKFVKWYSILNKINIKKSQKILTVSEFSKKEIMKYYGIKKEKIAVIYNGWEHIKKLKTQEEVISKFKLEGKEYILAVSSVNPNKNFKYILELAKLHQEYYFVIIGKKNNSIFSEHQINELDNLRWIGYVSDEDLKTLYSKAKAFVFPSFYEGFGIPPLEAIACGCKNIFVSNTSCLPEIYEDKVNYINPKIPSALIFKDKSSEELLKKYSWEKSANTLHEILIFYGDNTQK